MIWRASRACSRRSAGLEDEVEFQMAAGYDYMPLSLGFRQAIRGETTGVMGGKQSETTILKPLEAQYNPRSDEGQTRMWAEEGEDARSFGERIEQRVAELADEAMTDWWQARQRAHSDTTPALTGPMTASWRRVWELDASHQRRKGPRRRTWPR